MKNSLILMSVTTLLAASSISAQAQENSIYVPVTPCRIVDTRPANGGTGPLDANSSRDFLASGTVSGQGGSTGGCPAPRPGSEPVAISAYVIAVPAPGSTAGVLTAYPSDQPAPAVGAGSTVNYAAGAVVGNTTNISLCQPGGSCPAGGEFAVLARGSSSNVVVDVQGYFYPATGTCPDDMVASGNLCVDKYEASLWDASTGGTQIAASTCLADGSDCGKNAANPIYARSVAGMTPAGSISWYQAVQACANVGKRLPTTSEWEMAAAGTPPGTGDCNTSGGTIAATGASPTCVSSAGAFDMVGNQWEWVAELTDLSHASGYTFTSTDDAAARILGGSYSSGTAPKGTYSVATVGQGPLNIEAEIGFRCVR